MRPADDDGDPKVLRYLKTYAVFNAEQLTDCPRALSAPSRRSIRPSARQRATPSSTPFRLEIEYGGGQPCYIPARDLIRLPAPGSLPFGRRLPGDQGPRATALVGRGASAESRLRPPLRRRGLRLRGALRRDRRGGAGPAHRPAARSCSTATPPTSPTGRRSCKDRPGALLEASGHAQRAVDFLLAFSQPARRGGRPGRLITLEPFIDQEDAAMGWLFMRSLGGHATPKAYLDAQFTYERPEGRSRVLASRLVGSANLLRRRRARGGRDRLQGGVGAGLPGSLQPPRPGGLRLRLQGHVEIDGPGAGRLPGATSSIS